VNVNSSVETHNEKQARRAPSLNLSRGPAVLLAFFSYGSISNNS
jgi:hypothetical protein